MGTHLPCPGHSESHHQTFYLFYLFYFRYIKALEDSVTLPAHTFPPPQLAPVGRSRREVFLWLQGPKTLAASA